MAEIKGPSSKCTKAPFHDLLLPRTSIITTRNKTLHDQRRRISDQGFGAKALNKYEPQVDHCTSLLTYAISQRLGTPLDVASLFHYFSFDLMGQLSFGKSFNMLATGKRHSDARRHDAPGSLHVDALARLYRLQYPRRSLRLEIHVRLVRRANAPAHRPAPNPNGQIPDITSWLIDAARKTHTFEADRSWLNGDASGTVVAASDTTATTLTLLFYHLTSPSAPPTPRKPAPLPPNPDARPLASLSHLNGAINETLRLQRPPPIPARRPHHRLHLHPHPATPSSAYPPTPSTA